MTVRRTRAIESVCSRPIRLHLLSCGQFGLNCTCMKYVKKLLSQERVRAVWTRRKWKCQMYRAYIWSENRKSKSKVAWREAVTTRRAVDSDGKRNERWWFEKANGKPAHPMGELKNEQWRQRRRRRRKRTVIRCWRTGSIGFWLHHDKIPPIVHATLDGCDSVAGGRKYYVPGLISFVVLSIPVNGPPNQFWSDNRKRHRSLFCPCSNYFSTVVLDHLPCPHVFPSHILISIFVWTIFLLSLPNNFKCFPFESVRLNTVIVKQK